ncbi:hypothetical protein NE237_028933 [Protea cynaroides]|uniref:Uncharacterized protein n=1 Tax=Protea cynaroides TaxID=273540 RepID=A0A9Q0GQ96_9MAGN|nr:hypothetical protein NE237_028933 [Protea cynaroides]
MHLESRNYPASVACRRRQEGEALDSVRDLGVTGFQLRFAKLGSKVEERLEFYVLSPTMTTAKIVGGTVGAFVIAYAVDHFIADKKLFGGTTPKTVASNEWPVLNLEGWSLFSIYMVLLAVV